MGSRAKLVTTVFSFIGLGSMASAIVYIVLLSAFKGAIDHDVNRLQWVWRLLFGIGLVPAFCTLYFRLTMKETKPYEQCWLTQINEESRDSLTRTRRRERDESHRKRPARTCDAVA